jgi:hypothetical protein
MQHKSIQKKLLSYLDKDLSDSESQKVRSHLEGCQICQDDLKDLELLWRMERPVKRMTAPPFLWTRIAARLKSEKKQGFFNEIKVFIFPLLRPALEIAVLILGVIGGIEFGNRIFLSSGDSSEVTFEKTIDSFGLNYFEVFPPGLFDDRVLALTESEQQK